jgi:integrase
MLLIQTKNITVKLRYYYSNNGQHWFQRSVPKALQRYYGNQKLVRHKLPSNNAQMLVEIDRLSRHYDQHFRALKSGEGGTPQQIQEQAVALLASHGVLPGEGLTPAKVPRGMYEWPHLDYIEEYLRDKKQAGTMTSVDILAEQILTKPLPLLLSQALELYFENHVKGQQLKFRNGVIKRWKNIYSATGSDIPLELVTRDMAKLYVKQRLNSVKTGTVDREVKTINAVINKAIVEASLKITNPFERLVIPNKGGDSKPREDFSPLELKNLIADCANRGDEIRIMVLVTCLTGARPGEIAGLRREDVYWNGAVPYIDIAAYASRTVKTKNSLRTVPLIPLAAKWLKAQLESHEEGVVFPRYCDGNEVFGENVSGATRRYIKTLLKADKSLYSGRHTVKTLLDEANTAEYLSEAIGGWGESSISRGYGKGHSLKQKYDALVGAFKPILGE